MAQATTDTASPLSDLTKFQRDLLVAVHATDGDPHDEVHGLAIKAAIEDAWGEDINHGRLYPNLDALVDMGLLSKGSLDDRTNSYALTRRGERELRAHVSWLNEHAADLL